MSSQTKKRALQAVIQFFIRWGSRSEVVFMKCAGVLKDLGFSAKSITLPSLHNFLSTLHACLKFNEPTLHLVLDLLQTCMKSELMCKTYLEQYSFVVLFELLKKHVSDTSVGSIVKLSSRYLLQQEAGKREFNKHGGMKLLVHMITQKKTAALVLLLLQMADVVTLPESGMASFLEYGGLRAIASLDRFYDIPLLEFSLNLIQYIHEGNQLKGTHKDVALAYLKSLTLKIDHLTPRDQRGGFETQVLKFIRILQQSGGKSKHDDISQVPAKPKIKAEDAAIIKIKTPRVNSVINTAVAPLNSESVDIGNNVIETTLFTVKTEGHAEADIASLQLSVPQLLSAPATTKLEIDTLAPLIKMLNSPDSHTRSEGVVLTRKLASRRAFSEDVCSRLTDCLIPLMETEEDHVQVNCCAAIASMSVYDKKREVMYKKGVIEALLKNLYDYNVALLEQSLKALRNFVDEETYTRTMLAMNGIRLFRMLIFSHQTTIQQNAKYCYDQLLKMGGKNAVAEASMIVNADPWELVMRKWEAQDL
ncbi:hypothetical protein HDU79_001348 [Rhizoclosmatium sp. JEL0117]|nr:hypothetical protein HDU79_001348 [Rhizoclosmatium sp. JEL0117]